MRFHSNIGELPQPQSEMWDWQMHAACRAMPIKMFYPPQGLRGYTLVRAEGEAKLVCAQCHVIDRCLQFALDIREPYGTWGGLTARERLQRMDSDIHRSEPEAASASPMKKDTCHSTEC